MSGRYVKVQVLGVDYRPIAELVADLGETFEFDEDELRRAALDKATRAAKFALAEIVFAKPARKRGLR